MPIEANSINAATTGIVGNTGTSFTATAVTQYDVIVGGSTSSTLSSVGPGSSGQVLQSAGNAANPAYSTATYPATTTVSQILYSSSANTVAGLATANSGVLLTSGSGVPSIATRFTLAAQPSFLATLGSVDTNATGDGTVYTLGTSGTALTITFDRGSNFNSNGTFTAPVTGIYRFDVCIMLGVLGAGHTSAQMSLTSSSADHVIQYNPTAIKNPGNQASQARSILVSMTANDTAIVTITVSNSTKTVAIIGAPTFPTTFSGNLVC